MHDMRFQPPTLEQTPLKQVRLLTLMLPPLLLGSVELLRNAFAPDLLETRWMYTLFVLAVLAGMLAFAWAVNGLVERMSRRHVRQTEELLALHDASLAIVGHLRLEPVLQLVVDRASSLIGARYGAISYSRNLPDVDVFITHGIDPEVQRAIGPLPHGRGLLGVPIASGEALRTDNIARDPRSIGFPPNHPPMTQLLAVPVVGTEGVLGNLYLADKVDGSRFTEADETSLKRFSALAAIAIENAILHEQAEANATLGERARIAREMHDSLAQVLAFTNTKSQAAIAHLNHGDIDRARTQIDQLAASAREAYVDVREGIFALRYASSGHDRSFAESVRSYATSWQDQFHIPVAFSLSGTCARLAPLAELHLMRLIQEAMTNVRKQANASHLRIAMECTETDLKVTIADDGQGFAFEQLPAQFSGGFGMETMRERAEVMGGTFHVESAPGQGTIITVQIPVPKVTGER
jgi:signal transduction histidine kinase